MNTPLVRFLPLLALAACLLPFTAHAQFSADGETITVTTTTTSALSPYAIGSGYNTNTLEITSGGSLTLNAGGNQQLRLGVSLGDVNNSLIVTGAGSTLVQNTGEFNIGVQAGGNTVTVSNGGYLNAGAWGTSISGSSGTGNNVYVTGAGSIFSTLNLTMNAGGSNGVSILDGGTFNAADTLKIGNVSGSNTVSVGGTNSVANIASEVAIGSIFTPVNDNALIVNTGGTVNVTDASESGKGIVIQGVSGATGNKVQIDGGTLNVVSAGAGTPAIDVQKGALILNSGTVTTERLLANTDATSVVTFNGGVLNTQGTTLANGAVFTVGNGTSAARLNLAGGSHSFANNITLANNATLSGTGTITAGSLVVSSGATLSPGNSPGTLTVGATTLNGGGNYNWQVVNATGAAGTGFDTIALNPGSVLTLTNTSGDKFNINLWSLSSIGPDVNGDASNFNNTVNQSWTLIATDQSIVGFDAAAFTVNVGAVNGTAGFSNALGGGAFSVALGDSNTDLVLIFTAVPEPSTLALLGLGLVVVTVFQRRKRIA